MFVRNDHVWLAFLDLCSRHFERMREEDMDYEAMQTVLHLAEKRQMWKFVREYNETYFSELIQTLEERARKTCQDIRQQE